MFESFFVPNLHPKYKRFVLMNSALIVGLSFCTGAVGFSVAPPDAISVLGVAILGAFMAPSALVRRYGRFTPLNSCIVGVGAMIGAAGLLLPPVLPVVGLMLVSRTFSKEIALDTPR